MDELFKSLSDHFSAHGIEAEAVTDAQSKIVSLRFYLAGKAFTLHPEVDGEGRNRIAIGEFEALEPEEPTDRIEHVLEALRRTGLIG